ncbi:MAG: hypothetical protein CENE_00538 [Candidatus Celerinatantimonas neptuna]|nr:MAG: hypothetical protein CENE_00538 [Candidatus Celerinatantimonas neptuna]
MCFTLRKAQLTDINSILAIENDCFSSDLILPRQMRYLICQAKAVVLVVESERKVVGYAILLLPQKPRRARLYSIAVTPSMRRKRVGFCLVEKVLDISEREGYHAIGLEVRCSDLGAQALYQRFGFRWTHLMDCYYSDGDDGWKMVCQLPRPEWAG